MVVGDHQLHTRKSSPLQGPEELLVGGLALGVCDPYAKDLPEAVVPNARDDQNAPVNHLMVHPDLLVAGIHEHVGVGPRFESAIPPGLELRVEGAGQGRNEALGEGGPAQLFCDFLDLPGRDPLHLPISMSAEQSALSFLW